MEVVHAGRHLCERAHGPRDGASDAYPELLGCIRCIIVRTSTRCHFASQIRFGTLLDPFIHLSLAAIPWSRSPTQCPNHRGGPGAA